MRCFLKQKRPVSLLSGTKIDTIYLVWNTFYKLFSPKDPHQKKKKVKNNFRNFFLTFEIYFKNSNVFEFSRTTAKEQQQNYEHLFINKKVVYVLRKL